jgi:hypothetical protein
MLYPILVPLWLFSGMIIWLIWAEGVWFLSWGRTWQALVLFMVLGPISILAFPIERIIEKIRKHVDVQNDL